MVELLQLVLEIILFLLLLVEQARVLSNGVSMAASSTSNTISSTTLNDGEQVTVRVTNAQGCSSCLLQLR